VFETKKIKTHCDRFNGSGFAADGLCGDDFGFVGRVEDSLLFHVRLIYFMFSNALKCTKNASEFYGKLKRQTSFFISGIK
jgi:hypothetical protein